MSVFGRVVLVTALVLMGFCLFLLTLTLGAAT
jgi:hypothetical protein